MGRKPDSRSRSAKAKRPQSKDRREASASGERIYRQVFDHMNRYHDGGPAVAGGRSSAGVPRGARRTRGRLKVSPLPPVRADRSLQRPALVNLVSNALKFSRTRAQAVVEIGQAPSDDGTAVIFVRDNGVGFDARNVEKLFGVFRRLHSAEEFEGSGGRCRPRRNFLPGAGRGVMHRTMNEPGTILYAEDDERDLERTLGALAERNLANHVKVVPDGEEALNCLYRRVAHEGRVGDDPGLILFDIKMPKVDGFQVLRQIKSDARLKTIPVVVLSSSGEERDPLESYQLGVNAYVVKPVEFEKFLEAVREIALFWTLLNERPPRSRRAEGPA